MVVYQKVLTTGCTIFTNRCGSLGMFLVSLLHERKCLRNDLLKINCYLNVLFIIWFLYVLISILFVLWHIRRNDLGRNLFICRSATDIHAVVMGYSLCLILRLFFYNSLSTYMLYGYHSNESVFWWSAIKNCFQTLLRFSTGINWLSYSFHAECSLHQPTTLLILLVRI